MLVSLLLLLISTLSESANILVLHPIYCGSHEFILRKMGDQLVARGHEVTQVYKIKSKFLYMFVILWSKIGVFWADIHFVILFSRNLQIINNFDFQKRYYALLL